MRGNECACVGVHLCAWKCVCVCVCLWGGRSQGTNSLALQHQSKIHQLKGLYSDWGVLPTARLEYLASLTLCILGMEC